MIDDPLTADQLASRIDGRSAGAIATTLGRDIRDGQLAAGAALPTVRALADALGISASTVSDAWRTLRTAGLITTDRRRGTLVRDQRPGGGERWWHVPVEPGTLAVDLSTGTPDPLLLPDLAAVLHDIPAERTVTSYLDRPLLPELEEVLRAGWPFTPEMMTVVDGAQDALDRLIGATIGLGDRVVVETPTFPPLLDMLDLTGAEIVGVPVDDEGLRPDRLADVLGQPTRAVILQPRAHNPTGASLTEHRAADLARVLEPASAWIIEDDHSGDVAGSPPVSLGTWLPRRTLHIRSFSKSHGPDLRLAALGGPAEPIDALVRRRQLGPSWTSRLLQRVLLGLLLDPATGRLVRDAAATYAERRHALVAALGDEGFALPWSGHGLNLWVPVDDERAAAVALAASGVGVAPGRPFEVDPDPNGHHVRVTIATITDPARVARLVAEAARPGGVSRGR